MPRTRTAEQVRAKRSTWLALWPVVVALLLALNGSALARPGDLDRSFGEGGRVLTLVPKRRPPTGNLEIRSWLNTPVSTAIGTGGWTVAAAERTVVAYQRDGQPDRHFGRNGRVNVPQPEGTQTTIEDVAIDAEGRVVVIATVRGTLAGAAVMVLRLLPNGRPDTSFWGPGQGVLLTDFGLPAPVPRGPSAPPQSPVTVEAEGIAIDSQGRLVIAGAAVSFIGPCRGAGEQPHHRIYIARLLPDGNLDPGFGKGGTVVNDQPWLGDIALDGSGQAIYTTDLNDAAGCEGYGGGLMARLDAAGALDTSFGNGGVQSVSPAQTRPLRIAIDRSNRILVMRNATSGESKYLVSFHVVSRWNADGSLDASFGTDGETAIPLPGEGRGLNALAVDSRGRALLAGSIAPTRTTKQVRRHEWPRPRFVLVRLQASGRLDGTFGANGLAITGFGRGSRAVATDLAVRGNLALAVGPARSPEIAPRRALGLARYRLR
jgi:uncharacterized delta-60 repeat protein